MDADRFRRIYAVEPSHDLSALKNYTNDIEFITTGYENLDVLLAKIETNLQDFDPKKDAFVPIGKLLSVLLSGMVLHKLVGDAPIHVGIYGNKDYRYISVTMSEGVINAT